VAVFPLALFNSVEGAPTLSAVKLVKAI